MSSTSNKPSKSYTRKELTFIIVLSLILVLLVGGAIAIIVVETRNTTTVGNSVAYATPAPQPEDPSLLQQQRQSYSDNRRCKATIGATRHHR